MRLPRDPRSLPRSRRAALALVLLVAAGCSSDDTATPGTATPGTSADASAPDTGDSGEGTCPGGPSAVTCLSFELTGDLSFRAADVPGSTPSALSCADWAAGGNELAGADRFTLPFPDGTVDGKVVAVLATVVGYSGPGTYDLAELAGLGESIQLSVDDDAFESTPATTGTVTVSVDGSGSLVIDGLARLGVGADGPPALSGSMSWTCAEAS